MAESAVLFHSHSFAAPLTRNESFEDNTNHALSQSVSFGRFMTENLEWGKWSSFSHKKYVDEAEKFSQPGSVAQKKAFFEAHYKKIAEAKKAKASGESSDDSKQEQQAESVAVLLNTLETLTKDEVKEKEEEESIETELVLSSEELVKEQEDSLVVEDDLQVGHEVVDEIEEKVDGELLKKSGEEEERRSVSNKNSSSMEKSETPEKAMKLFISKSPITHNTSMKRKEKPVRPRFSFLNFLMGNTKTQDQNTTRKKVCILYFQRPNKPFLCLCFNPEMVGETEAPTKTQRRNL
ncbi:unnamed protein product [Thlaspi arvense]|uniref:Protein WVD2-like 7 n=1 Tax=Thlaspi arvense TaxID=13288 RepID=A0AAU9T9R9_THLAR|nr:unnamed protein product [Thlaspi arvense]